MDHEDVRTTFNLYGHLFPDREDELVKRLEKRRSAVSLGCVVDQIRTKGSAEVVDLDGNLAPDQAL
jgi:hypothetical protein